MATTVTIAVFNLSTELSDDQVMGALPPPVGSRRERRRTPREQWLRSAPTGKYQ